ncbi:MAG: hypothetical protein NTY25_07385 [Planctomycetia bacterium]|nr:hypothetical protein [Planctomycetia bacterium]
MNAMNAMNSLHERNDNSIQTNDVLRLRAGIVDVVSVRAAAVRVCRTGLARCPPHGLGF